MYDVAFPKHAADLSLDMLLHSLFYECPECDRCHDCEACHTCEYGCHANSGDGCPACWYLEFQDSESEYWEEWQNERWPRP